MDDRKVKVQITEGCLFAVSGEETRHVAPGEVLELTLEDALSLVGAGRAVTLTKRPAQLKDKG